MVQAHLSVAAIKPRLLGEAVTSVSLQCSKPVQANTRTQEGIQKRECTFALNVVAVIFFLSHVQDSH